MSCHDVFPGLTVVLVRHAKACRPDDAGVDLARLLTRRGHCDARRMALRLVAYGVIPDLIICSPAARTRQTAVHFAQVCGYPQAAIQQERLMYPGDCSSLLTVMQRCDARYRQVVMVGHNPAFCEIAQLLSGRGEQRFPTAAMLGVLFAATTWQDIGSGNGQVLFFDYPKKTGQ